MDDADSLGSDFDPEGDVDDEFYSQNSDSEWEFDHVDNDDTGINDDTLSDYVDSETDQVGPMLPQRRRSPSPRPRSPSPPMPASSDESRK